MTLPQLFHHIRPFARPYRPLIAVALLLTFVGSLTAQVNAWVLRYAVDAVSKLLAEHKSLLDGREVLIAIAAILLGKEIINVFLQFGQKYYGEKLRIELARDLAQTVIAKILAFKLAFYATDANQPGKLQTRIDRGIESLARLVQNFFIDILPLFANAAVALLMMFHANVWVGLVGFVTVPIYYWVSRVQARRLTRARRTIKNCARTKARGF